MTSVMWIVAAVLLAGGQRWARACSEEDLIMVQLLSGHGDSAPVDIYPTDPNPPSLWKEGLGDLTMLGKFREYALGTILRVRYKHLITTDPREVDVYSSSHNACVKGALTFITSLYDPRRDWEIVKDVPYQPIIVKYLPRDQDKYFEMANCPAADQEYERILSSPSAEAFKSKFQDLFDFWSRHSGWKIQGWDSVALLHDVLEIEREYNLTIPAWAMKYWEEMKMISEMSLHWNFGTTLMQKFRAGPLIKLILDKMIQRAAGSMAEKKMIVYKTHTKNLAAFMAGLNIFNWKKPPFSATLAVEFFEHDSEYFVRFLYLNTSSPETYPQVLHLLYLEGCDEFCPLDYVVDYAKNVSPSNWEEECNQSPSLQLPVDNTL